MAVAALLIGLLLVGGSFLTDTAPEGTHNLGLLQQQMMTLHVGLALLIVAAIRWDRVGNPSRTQLRQNNVDADEAKAADVAIDRGALVWIGGLVIVIALALWFANGRG